MSKLSTEELKELYPGRPTEHEQAAIELCKATALAAAEMSAEEVEDRVASALATLGSAKMSILLVALKLGVLTKAHALYAEREDFERTIARLREAEVP